MGGGERVDLGEALRARLAAAGLEAPADDADRLERDLALHLERVAALAAAADLGPGDPPRTDPTTAVAPAAVDNRPRPPAWSPTLPPGEAGTGAQAEGGARIGAQAVASQPAPRSAGPRTGRVADGEDGGPPLSTTPVADGEAGSSRLPTTPVADDEAGASRLSTAPAAGGPAAAEAAMPAADVDDVTAASLRFASGAVGTVASSCLLPRLHRAGVQVIGDGLSLELSETALVAEVEGRRSAWEADADARPRPDRDFVAAVRGGPDRIRVPWPEAYRTHLLACAITRSAEEGRPLAVPEGSGEPRRGAPVDRGADGHG
jgi:hypothetical protein